MPVTQLFSHSVYTAVLPDMGQNELLYNVFKKETANVQRGGDNWESDVYNTLGTWDPRQHHETAGLVDIITQHVQGFSDGCGYAGKYQCVEAWGNLYGPNDYQEYHEHNRFIWSACYYAKLPEGENIIVFKSPFIDMLDPPKKESNNINASVWQMPVEEGMIAVWRSHLSHMVPPHRVEGGERLSFAFNFTLSSL